MAAENEHVGDHPDEVESIDEDEEAGKDANKFMNFHDVFTALKSQHLANTMASLPPSVQRRIKALKKIQLEATDIEAKFFEEVHKLECKYHSSFVPLFEKRHTIITGAYEPTDEEAKWASEDEDEVNAVSKQLKNALNVSEVKETGKGAKEGGKDAGKEKEGAKGKEGDAKKAESKEKAAVEDVPTKGIPEFWLTVFKNVSLLADMVQDHDEPILKHLTDIKTNLTETPMGFTLEFHFESNEYFTNSVLIKEYEMRCEPDEDDPFGFEGPEIIKCRGCTINWNKGKDITKKTVKKKQKHKNRGVVRTVTKVVENDSFFNFFSPPTIPENINAADVDEDVRNLITSDFEIGHYIRDRVVPRAVLYFTGEAVEDNEDDYEEESEEEDDEESGEDSDFRESSNEQNCKQQ